MHLFSLYVLGYVYELAVVRSDTFLCNWCLQKAGGPVVGQSVEEGARGLIFAATNPDMAGAVLPLVVYQSLNSSKHDQSTVT